MTICLLVSCASGQKSTRTPVVGVAWSDSPGSYSYRSTVAALEACGAEVVLLDMVKSNDLEYTAGEYLFDYMDLEHWYLSEEGAEIVKKGTWRSSNVQEVLEGVDCVVVPGGVDISPTLYKDPQGWHGLEEDSTFAVERDVSDYILVSYCLDNDIPLLAICRGMQMLSIVSGAEVAQDIGAWLSEQGLSYNDEHRDPDRKVYTAHSVDVAKKSLLYKITGKKVLEKVPSWHHQAIIDVEGTGLTVTGTCVTSGVTMIEAVERRDLGFCLGVQFHPEISIGKAKDGSPEAANFMDYDVALSLFQALVDAAR